MKKILAVLLSLFVLTGCMGNESDKQNTQTPENNNESYSESDTSQQSQNVMGDWYGNFEKELTGKDFTYSSKQKLDTIDGVEGYRYVSDQGNIDIYKYEDGKDFDEIVKNKKVTIDGKEYPVEINGNYVIVNEGLDQGIIDIFKNMR